MPFDSMTITTRLANPSFPAWAGAAATVPVTRLDYGRQTYLPRRNTLVLDDAQGSIIVVDRGCVWVTLESDIRDIILARGMRFEVDRSGRTIIAAEEDSRLRIIEASTRGERVAARLRSAGSRVLRDWSRVLARKPVPYY